MRPEKSASPTPAFLILAGLTGVTDAELVAIGASHTVPQLETACRAARRLARDVDTTGDARRHLRWRRDDNGTFHFNARLHGSDAIIVTNLLTAMAEAARPDPTTGEHTPFDVRCADALVDMCSPHDTARPDRAEVVIHVPLHLLPDPHDRHGNDPDQDDSPPPDEDPAPEGDGDRLGVGVAMTWDGTTISNAALRRLLCDSRLRLTLDDLDGNAVGIGRLSKSVPEWLARQVRWRDQGCRFPGCEETRWLHNHTFGTGSMAALPTSPTSPSSVGPTTKPFMKARGGFTAIPMVLSTTPAPAVRPSPPIRRSPHCAPDADRRGDDLASGDRRPPITTDRNRHSESGDCLTLHRPSWRR